MMNMINEHDMTKKMLNLIREAIDNNQGSIGLGEPDAPVDSAAPNEEGGPVTNIALTCVLPSGIQFTVNYDENSGVTIINPEQIELDNDILKQESQLLTLRKQFVQIWLERGAQKDFGKKQRIIFKNGQYGNGPDDKNWFETDTAIFEDIISKTNLTWLSYIINP